jgi:hypothetical protein
MENKVKPSGNPQHEKKVIVSDSVFLTENEIAELANVGSQYLYLGAMDEGRLSYEGVLKILKRYEELRNT